MGILKRLLGISNNQDGKIIESFREKADKLQQFAEEKIEYAKQEYQVTRKKLDNLRETNYHQGLRYLEKGDIRDAILRFRIVVKFWPDYLDAYYQLAYCLMLNKKPHKAKAVLEGFLNNHPNYDQKAYDLLEKINQSLANVQ